MVFHCLLVCRFGAPTRPRLQQWHGSGSAARPCRLRCSHRRWRAASRSSTWTVGPPPRSRWGTSALRFSPSPCGGAMGPTGMRPETSMAVGYVTTRTVRGPWTTIGPQGHVSSMDVLGRCGGECGPTSIDSRCSSTGRSRLQNGSPPEMRAWLSQPSLGCGFCNVRSLCPQDHRTAGVETRGAWRAFFWSGDAA